MLLDTSLVCNEDRKPGPVDSAILAWTLSSSVSYGPGGVAEDLSEKSQVSSSLCLYYAKGQGIARADLVRRGKTATGTADGCRRPLPGQDSLFEETSSSWDLNSTTD